MPEHTRLLVGDAHHSNEETMGIVFEIKFEHNIVQISNAHNNRPDKPVFVFEF